MPVSQIQAPGSATPRRSRLRSSVRAIVGLTLLAPLASHAVAQIPPAQPAPSQEKVSEAGPMDLQVFATGAIDAPISRVRAQAERATRTPMVIETGAARGSLRSQILEGVTFDVAILSAEVAAELIEAGKLRSPTYEIGRVQIALGARGDVPAHLDVASPAGVKAALLGAKSVRFNPEGMGGPTARKIIADLGLNGLINEVHGATVPNLAPGEYEIAINPLSEIIAMKATRNLGPVIPTLQLPVVIVAAVSTTVKLEPAAKRFIAFLRGPQMSASLTASGYAHGKVPASRHR